MEGLGIEQDPIDLIIINLDSYAQFLFDKQGLYMRSPITIIPYGKNLRFMQFRQIWTFWSSNTIKSLKNLEMTSDNLLDEGLIGYILL